MQAKQKVHGGPGWTAGAPRRREGTSIEGTDQIRLSLTACAYVLVEALRRWGLKHTLSSVSPVPDTPINTKLPRSPMVIYRIILFISFPSPFRKSQSPNTINDLP